MLSIIPIFIFMTLALCFIGALFDIDWIMKLTRADRRYGRKFARISWGIVGFLGIVVMVLMLIN